MLDEGIMLHINALVKLQETLGKLLLIVLIFSVITSRSKLTGLQ